MSEELVFWTFGNKTGGIMKGNTATGEHTETEKSQRDLHGPKTFINGGRMLKSKQTRRGPPRTDIRNHKRPRGHSPLRR